MTEKREPQWVEIPSNEVDDFLRQSSARLQFSIRMAPHDIPNAVRGYFDEKIQRFVVEFRYIDEDEPWRRSKSDSPVILRIGKHSERLLGLEIDVQELKADSVGVRIMPQDIAEQASVAIDSFVHKRPIRPRKESKERSYQVAQKILRREREKVFHDLTPA